MLERQESAASGSAMPDPARRVPSPPIVFPQALVRGNISVFFSLIRDPQDTVVSFYFQATRRSRVYSGAFRNFLQDPRFGIERIIRFNLLWLC
jgi:hypothetical protein